MLRPLRTGSASLGRAVACALTLIVAASGHAATIASASIAPFGVAADGEAVSLVTLTNARGMVVRISTRGGTITELDAPDRQGRLADIVLGKPDFAAWEKLGAPFNAIVGRYANRIAGGGFTLDGHFYRLAGADPRTGIVSHGGPIGFHERLWTPTPFHDAKAAGVLLRYVSPAGENGFPGTLDVRVTYTLGNDDTLTIAYHATTSHPTILNLTSHLYFHLGGPAAGPVYDEMMQVFASRYTPADTHQVPTGELRSVSGTPFDCRIPVRVGDRIYATDPEMLAAHGLDQNFVLDKPAGVAMPLAVRLHDLASGRILEVRTTQPGVQIYSGNYFNGSEAGASGRALRQGDGLAFETQHFPDSPHHPDFPSTVLRPGETFRSTTEFAFSTDAEAPHPNHEERQP